MQTHKTRPVVHLQFTHWPPRWVHRTLSMVLCSVCERPHWKTQLSHPTVYSQHIQQLSAKNKATVAGCVCDVIAICL